MSGSSPPVAVVTVNWNGAELTLRCLEALRRSEGATWHLYVVDNASTDGSADRLAAAFATSSDVTLLRSPVNGGWTGGNNLGMRQAIENGHDFVFILNNDAFVRPSTIQRLLDHWTSRASEMPVLGPVHQGAESSQYDFRVAHFEAKTGIPVWTYPAQQGSSVREPIYETAYVSGAGLFIHRRHLEQVGLLDDRFFLNFDDTDWCSRAREAGFPLLMVRDAVIDHVGSASIGGIVSPLQTYFLTRNRLLYAEKHRPLLDRVRLLRRQIWRARELVQGSAFKLLLPQTDPVIAAFRRGLLDYVRRRFGDCPDMIRIAQRAAAATLTSKSS